MPRANNKEKAAQTSTADAQKLINDVAGQLQESGVDFVALLTPAKVRDNASTSISTPGKYRRMFDRYFKQRGKLSDFVVSAIDHYLQHSGVELLPDGTLLQKKQTKIDLGEAPEKG